MPFLEYEIAFLRGDFIVTCLPFARYAAAGEGERHHAVSVCARPQRGAMIGRNQNAPIAVLGKRFQQRADDVAVDFLQRLHFRICLALVRCLIRRLDVDADQIVLRQSGDGGPPLSSSQPAP